MAAAGMRVTEVRKAGWHIECRPEMNTYDAGGQVCSIKGVRDGRDYTYVADIRYDEYGQRIYIKYGNGVETNYTYDTDMRWLKHIDTANTYGTQYQNIEYTFDDVGNVEKYTNDCMNGARYRTEQTYTYDALYQLIKAEGVTEDNPYAIPNSPDYRSNYEQNFSFDAIGNMMHKDSKETITPAIQKKGGDDLNYDLTYEYDANYAHRLTRAGSEQKGWRYYTYDDNGNVTSESDGIAPNEDTATLTPVTVTTHTNEAGDSVYEADYAWAWPWGDSDTNSGKVSPNNKRIYEWNSRNLLMRSVALGYDTRYAYSADGNRAAKWTTGNLSETLYFNTMWTWHIEKGLSQEQQGQYSKHIYLGETRIVTKQTSDLEENYGPSEELRHQYYYHPDHLGSAQLVTDYEGNEYQRIEYTPYGELWVEKKTANEKDMRYLPYKFTAKEQDEETGLYYYGARYLDAKYSRWLSADPAVSDYIPQAPVDDEARKHNQNLPGMGGVFNVVNFQLYHYAGNNPVKYTDPDGRSVGSALWLIYKHRDRIKLAAKIFNIDPVGIASVIFQEKYHGLFATLKNGLAFFIDDGVTDESPITRSYGLAEMQLGLVADIMGKDISKPGVKEEMFKLLQKENWSIAFIAAYIARNEKEMGQKLKGADAAGAYNMGAANYEQVLKGKKNKSGVAKRSEQYQQAIKDALEGIIDTRKDNER